MLPATPALRGRRCVVGFEDLAAGLTAALAVLAGRLAGFAPGLAAGLGVFAGRLAGFAAGLTAALGVLAGRLAGFAAGLTPALGVFPGRLAPFGGFEPLGLGPRLLVWRFRPTGGT